MTVLSATHSQRHPSGIFHGENRVKIST